MATAFLIQPLSAEFARIRQAMVDFASQVGFEVKTVDSLPADGLIMSEVVSAITSADVVIADVTGANPNVMYELAHAHASGKPVLLMSSGIGQIPFDLRDSRVLLYRADDPRAFVPDTLAMLSALRDNPEHFVQLPQAQRDINRVFISYSHKDSPVLDRLLVHLRPLAREGKIDPWNDTAIDAGSDWKREIKDALHHARVAILLVTADFLASDFIVDNELPPLLEAAETAGTQMIPIIVKPCRYVRDRRLRHLQAINDPSHPLLSLSEVEQEQLLDDVASAVERAVAPAE